MIDDIYPLDRSEVKANKICRVVVDHGALHVNAEVQVVADPPANSAVCEVKIIRHVNSGPKAWHNLEVGATFSTPTNTLYVRH